MSWTSSTPIPAACCGRFRASAPPGSARRCARGRRCGGAARCASSWPNTASRPRPRHGSSARSGPRRSRCCAPTRTPRRRWTVWASPPLTALRVPWAPIPEAPERLDAGVLHVLSEAERDGHCLLPRTDVVARAESLLGLDVDGRIDELVARGRLVADGDLLADPAMDGLERRLARCARALATADPVLKLDDAGRPTEGEFIPTDDAVGRRGRGAQRAPGDPDRRAGHRQDGDDARPRRPRAGLRPPRAPLRSDREGRPPAVRGDRRAGDDDSPPARVDSGRGLRARPGRPDHRRRRARRRRGVDAVRPAGRRAARRRRQAARTCCSWATSTSSRPSARERSSGT